MATSCTWLPREFNLSPLYRQRLDVDGTPLEVDALWPLFHYERTPEGGHDCRIRPFYRRVTEPETVIVGQSAVEHQYLWPLGRHRSDEEQTLNRLWPVRSWRDRLDETGQRDVDWYFLFPFFFGGWHEKDDDAYFAFFPLFGDLPDFLTYERFTFALFPLYLRLQKENRLSHMFLWPLIGYGSGAKGYRWHRFLPFYSYSEWYRYRRWSVLWPFLHWGVENLQTVDPVYRYMIWPLWGEQWSDRIWGFTIAWPLIQFSRTAGQRIYLDFLWPFVRYEEDRREFRPMQRWWLFPIVSRTETDDQTAWSFLWPFGWLRFYDDPQGEQRQAWFLPFYTRVERDLDVGGGDEFDRFWPFFEWSREVDAEGRTSGRWAVLAPWLFRRGLAAGVYEAYDWIWTLARYRQRDTDDTAFDLTANLFTTRTRGPITQTSVPWLFGYESDAEGSVLRLFHFLPIRWNHADEADTR